MLNEITSGGATVNDAFFHGAIANMPFGGVGDSGQGAYRGQLSFETFTHRRSVATTPGWLEKMLAIRYPPYAGKLKKFQSQNGLKPNFDRSGNEIKGIGYWLGVVLSLGGDSPKSALKRWAAAVILAVLAKKAGDRGGLPSYLN